MRTYSRRRPEMQVIEGVHNLCRLCLEESDEMIPIFTEGSEGICATLSLRIMICVGLEVIREDSLPNIVCSTCHKELNRYYTFRKKCEVSYQRLKLHLQALKEKECLTKAMEQKEMEQKEIEQKEMEQKEILQQDDINYIIERVRDDSTKYTIENNQLPEVHVLGLNGLANRNVNNEQIQNMQQLNCTTQIENGTEKEIETQIHDADNPEISSFLSTILVQLGILEQHDDTLSIVDHGVNNLELVMGDDDTVTLELVEEDDVWDSTEESQSQDVHSKAMPVVLNSIANESDNNPNKANVDAALNGDIEEQVMTIKWKPEQVSGGAGGGAGAAWCGACGKWLASRGTLRRHLRVHTGEKPFACKECGRRFAQREVLERHRLVHLERRPFACPCGKSFTQRGALQAHARAHAAPHARPLQLHACTRCPKLFLYASSLSRHMMMHKGRMYVCSACQRQFRDKSSLLRHLRGNAHATSTANDDANTTDTQASALATTNTSMQI